MGEQFNSSSITMQAFFFLLLAAVAFAEPEAKPEAEADPALLYSSYYGYPTPHTVTDTTAIPTPTATTTDTVIPTTTDPVISGRGMPRPKLCPRPRPTPLSS